MREFVYYSKHAVTTGNFQLDNLMKAGRMDIACKEWGTTKFIVAEGGPSCPTLLSTVATPVSNTMLNIVPNASGMAYVDQFQLFSDSSGTGSIVVQFYNMVSNTPTVVDPESGSQIYLEIILKHGAV